MVFARLLALVSGPVDDEGGGDGDGGPGPEDRGG